MTFSKMQTIYCSSWDKDTKLRANHNYPRFAGYDVSIVPLGTKILN